MQNQYDYIIVGAGSAGNVLALRLTENPNTHVLLLEAGGPDYRFDFRTQMPAALAFPLQGRRYNWAYTTEPEPYMDGRRMSCGRGKGLGGSSLINGMCYIRGNALDLDGWAENPGLEHWSYLDCLPYYRRAENRDIGANDYHGTGGPLDVATPKTGNNPLFDAMVQAGEQAGYDRTDDLNGYRQEGFGPMDRTTTPKGRRASTARGYLDRARDRPNLTIHTRALAEHILFDGDTAVGVHYKRHGNRHTAYAHAEVLVCSGAIASPALLQRSGIGPAEVLKAAGIPLRQALSGVGAGLQDHLELYMQYACLEPISLYPALLWRNRPAIGAQWLFSGSGIGASNQFEAGGFIRTSSAIPWPNIQYHFLPVAVNYDGSGAIRQHGFQAHVGTMRSRSTGSVKVRSANAAQPPKIQFNYMAHEEDWTDLRAAIRITREIMRQPALARYCGPELNPGASAQTDQELNTFIRQTGETAYHPCGTCAMGTGTDAVVDGRGRVHGVAGLRVIDASIMPRIITGNLNATTIMMAERLADDITGTPALARADVPYYVASRTPKQATTPTTAASPRSTGVRPEINA